MKKLTILMIAITLSCKPTGKSPEPEPVYVVIDGHNVELVADEDENQYLKQKTYEGAVIYIPFPYNTSENKDSITYYQVKNEYNSRRLGKNSN